MQEEIRDLLSKDQNKRLELKERPDTGIYVKVSDDVNFCGKITFDSMYTGVKIIFSLHEIINHSVILKYRICKPREVKI